MGLINKILNEALQKRFKFPMFIPEDVKNIAATFHNNGYDLFICGGAVRDALQNKKPKDYDLATNALPTDTEKIMQKAGYRTLATGKAFGVIQVFTDTDNYEIATFREDIGNADNRRPESVKFTTIEGDVQRRDLTINAIFYDINKKEVVDLVNGVEDLKQNKVKTVGAAIERFTEDRLRILRAIRFATRMNAKLDPSIDLALSANSSLKGISNERIKDEFIKSIISAKDIMYLLQLYVKYNLFPEVLKGLNVEIQPIQTNNHVVVLATILKNNLIELVSRQLNKLTYSVNDIRGVTFLLKLLNFKIEDIVAMKKASQLSHLDNKEILKFAEINDLDVKEIKALLNFKFSVNAQELMDKGLSGTNLGKEINRLEIENFKKMLEYQK